jgi:hypothetical protein
LVRDKHTGAKTKLRKEGEKRKDNKKIERGGNKNRITKTTKG